MTGRDVYDLLGSLALGVAVVFIGERVLRHLRERSVIDAADSLTAHAYEEGAL